jgi:hypothetical protein
MNTPEWYQRKNDEKIDQLSDEVRTHIESELQRDSAMAIQFAQLQAEVKELNESVSAIVELLAQTKGALAFIKILAAIVAAGAATWAWIMSNLSNITTTGNMR